MRVIIEVEDKKKMITIVIKTVRIVSAKWQVGVIVKVKLTGIV